NLEVAFPFDFEVAAVAFVADQTFIALAQLLAQVGHDGLTVVGVFASFFLVEADHVPTRLRPDLLDFERGGILGALALRHPFQPAAARRGRWSYIPYVCCLK